MRMFSSLTVIAVVLLSPIHVNAQDASQVKQEKWELYGKLLHLREQQSRLMSTSTALSERASSLQSAAKIASKEWDDLKQLVLDAHLAQIAKVDKAIDEWNARCKGITDKNKNFASCRNRQADLIAWRSAVDTTSEKLKVQVVAKEKEMASITVKLNEIAPQMDKKTAELNSVKIAMKTTQQMIDKIRTNERRGKGVTFEDIEKDLFDRTKGCHLTSNRCKDPELWKRMWKDFEDEGRRLGRRNIFGELIRPHQKRQYQEEYIQEQWINLCREKYEARKSGLLKKWDSLVVCSTMLHPDTPPPLP